MNSCNNQKEKSSLEWQKFHNVGHNLFVCSRHAAKAESDSHQHSNRRRAAIITSLNKLNLHYYLHSSNVFHFFLGSFQEYFGMNFLFVKHFLFLLKHQHKYASFSASICRQILSLIRLKRNNFFICVIIYVSSKRFMLIFCSSFKVHTLCRKYSKKFFEQNGFWR